MRLKNPELFRQQCFVAGEWIAAKSGKTFEVYNPATGVSVGHVPVMGRDETRAAIAAAEAAWPAWRDLTARRRSRIVRRWYELIMENQEDL
ncbi:MAG TPA: aldehyde dehydrogenase family protein, partial [Desulfobacteraceae bacterium]|nr:aldehyde dehydrogenase family protein [Desulfobacteraceae bacterium]